MSEDKDYFPTVYPAATPPAPQSDTGSAHTLAALLLIAFFLFILIGMMAILVLLVL